MSSNNETRTVVVLSSSDDDDDDATLVVAASSGKKKPSRPVVISSDDEEEEIDCVAIAAAEAEGSAQLAASLAALSVAAEAPSSSSSTSLATAGATTTISPTPAALPPIAFGEILLDGAIASQLYPHQKEGVAWLSSLASGVVAAARDGGTPSSSSSTSPPPQNVLFRGGILADEMGLGKTRQVAAFLRGAIDSGVVRRALVVAPKSLLRVWAAELAVVGVEAREFGSGAALSERAAALAAVGPPGGSGVLLTTYGMLSKQEWLGKCDWSFVILDEAQAIKNPAARQTKAVKELRATHRIALTGTPIENRLGDLWSLFDYLNPGLLGSAKRFSEFIKAGAGDSERLGALRNLVRPYILRRLKTDKRIIADLPDKTEVKAYCLLTRKQAALYEQSVREMKVRLEAADGMARRGLVLGYIMRLKQICNHPSHWLRDQAYGADDSGKFVRLRELATEIAQRQEKALVFTQFQEMTGPLADCLAEVFRRPGLVLHGAIAVKDRRRLVEDHAEHLHLLPHG